MPTLPPDVSVALDRLKEELGRTQGTNFVGLILYGGLARGRYRPGKSDVNVVVLLRDASAARLTAIAPGVRAARRSANVMPLILTLAEVRPAALVFPTKFLDIKDHHVVLAGEDPFAALEVPREVVSRRIAQELRNFSLRLRNRFVATLDDPSAQSGVLADLARPLAIEVAALMRLAGKPMPTDDRSAAIFEAAATSFDADGEALVQIAGLRHNEGPSGDLTALFGRVLVTLDRLTDHAERLQEGPP
jgi:hypothetical protein